MIRPDRRQAMTGVLPPADAWLAAQEIASGRTIVTTGMRLRRSSARPH